MPISWDFYLSIRFTNRLEEQKYYFLSNKPIHLTNILYHHFTTRHACLLLTSLTKQYTHVWATQLCIIYTTNHPSLLVSSCIETHKGAQVFISPRHGFLKLFFLKLTGELSWVNGKAKIRTGVFETEVDTFIKTEIESLATVLLFHIWSHREGRMWADIFTHFTLKGRGQPPPIVTFFWFHQLGEALQDFVSISIYKCILVFIF